MREFRKVVFGAMILLLAPLSLTATPKPTPTRTPAPAPRRLSGGFGRPGPGAVATPAVTAVPGDRSLADTARAVGAARKRPASRPPVSITNETLVTDPKKGRLTTASPRSETPRAPAEEAVSPTPPPAAEAEAYWRERMRTSRGRVEELREKVRQFEQESKKLEGDFYSWDDGSYRDGVIKPAWDKKREELETARKDLEQAEKDLAELPEKARKAGALPGWLRE